MIQSFEVKMAFQDTKKETKLFNKQINQRKNSELTLQCYMNRENAHLTGGEIPSSPTDTEEENQT